MYWLKYIGYLLVVLAPLTLSVGCEHHHHGGDDENTSGTGGDGGGNGGGGSGGSNSQPTKPPVSASPEVTVVNNSTLSVQVTVNGTSEVLASASSKTWPPYSGSFTISFDTHAGFPLSETESDGRDWLYSIYNSTTVPGTVEMSGHAE